MKTISISQIVAGLLLPGAVQAQEVPKNPPQEQHVPGPHAHDDGDPGGPPDDQGWRKADTDGDGKLSKEEFMAITRIGQLPEEKRELLFARLDKDSNGSLDADELERGRPRRGRPMRRLWELDVDHSGGVSFEEFKNGEMFSKLPPEKCEELFKRLDTDGDGEITGKDRPEPRPAPEPAEIVKMLDTDGDGLVSYEEFKKDPFVERMIDREIEREMNDSPPEFDPEENSGE
ncbi:EF-hand domain-containing protein [Luteolibacter pohnpeiensis]|uniref:EF-hand domain-containing protein n=1 Tax=Luteolibacter pohnpeiensis TaxID=454153 RepID=A0A934S103_9BACT|nr:EF-hand domain-containing protein [Luteolibacter pohnpeiensis]MBK1881260.1 EF-hand domain-containing protein [Luteolibacter pohnpeiensis]